MSARELASARHKAKKIFDAMSDELRWAWWGDELDALDEIEACGGAVSHLVRSQVSELVQTWVETCHPSYCAADALEPTVVLS